MKALTDKNFAAWVKEMPTIVLFHADFAGPCNLAMPEFQAAHDRAGNRVQFCTFDLDGNPDTPARFNVKGIPNYIVFTDGKPLSMHVGALNMDQVLEIIADV